MDRHEGSLTALLLASGREIPDDLVEPPTAIQPLRVRSTRHYVFARTMKVQTVELESSGLNLEEVIIGEQVYRVSRAVIGKKREGEMRVLTAHTPSQDGWSKATLIATRQTPWTPEVATSALEHGFGGIDSISDGLWHPSKVTRVSEGGKPSLFELMECTSNDTDTFTVIGHVLSGARAEGRMAILEAMLADYPWLINATLYVDPNRLKGLRTSGVGAAPTNWVNGFFTAHAYMLNLDTISVTSQLISDPAPRDLMPETIQEWIKEVAMARCSYKWPQRPFVHGLVEHFADWLRASRSAQPIPAAPESAAPSDTENLRELIEMLRSQLTEANERAESEKERADVVSQQLRGCEGQLARAESDVKVLRKANKDLHSELRKLRLVPVEVHADSQPVAQDVTDDPELSEDVTLPLELVDAPGILRTPRQWEELLECAGKLKHVSLTEEAVEPALRRLAHHRHSRTLLGTSWNALRALDAWMAVPQGVRGTFQNFLADRPQPGMTPYRVAGGESSSTVNNDEMRAARTFKTALGDFVEMMPHIKLNKQGGSSAARMHYREDNELGVAHVGYIGPHLPNPHTPNI